MQLRLKTTKVKNLKLSNISKKAEDDAGMNFKFGAAFSETESNNFLVVFELTLNVEDANLSIEYEATFETDEIISDEFKNSHFSKVNAPAIAFPYLRAFISTFLLNSGYDPVMLPSVNFAALDKQNSDS